ncbi:peptidase M20 [Caulobacter sp. KR2-114]|uniref:peptidase M20 n=1 Tax=Caulobacter sp. KR2-114 TaxID=3400912 RepID=UPI003BFD7C03
MADGAFPFNVPAPCVVSEADRAAVAAAIDTQELTQLALDLGNIPSPAGHELAAGNFVFDWMAREGFNPRKVGAVPERNNIIGTWGGRGVGRNLLFTAHLDTEAPTWEPDLDTYKFRPATLQNREWQECWLEDGVLYGYPIANDRGPMSCFLMAAKALKTAGIDLAGKMYLTACPGEIGPEPIEEHRGIAYMGKDIGAHYLFHHGGVAPDYAIAAEGCDFGLTWVGCGYAVFRIKVLGEAVFTPLLNTPEDPAEHPNPIYRLGGLIAALNRWGREYQVKNTYDSPGGTAVPKTQIAAIRGGVPYAFGAGTEVVNVYLEVGMTPRQTVTDILHQLEALVREAGLGEVEIEPVMARHGFEADAEAVAPLVGAVDAATRLTFGRPVERAASVYSSMWRDHNVFNMQRIPAITTGFKRWRPSPKDLADSALIFALTAIAVCGKAEAGDGPARAAPVYGDNPFGN